MISNRCITIWCRPSSHSSDMHQWQLLASAHSTSVHLIDCSVHLKLSASPTPGSSRLGTYLRLACSFLVTPHPISLHTSGVLESLGRDKRAAAAGQVVSEWLLNQGQAAVPDSLVRQVSDGACCILRRLHEMSDGASGGCMVLLPRLHKRLCTEASSCV